MDIYIDISWYFARMFVSCSSFTIENGEVLTFGLGDDYRLGHGDDKSRVSYDSILLLF